METLKMENEKLMLERVCLECSITSKIKIDMSKAARLDQCLQCRQYVRTYKIVR